MRLNLKTFLYTSLVVTTAGTLVLGLRWEAWSMDVKYSEGSLQTNLFQALLTLSGLLLTVKTMLFVKMEEGLYAKEEYLRRYAGSCLDNQSARDGYLSPLKRMTSALLWTSAVLALGGTFNVTLGYLPWKWIRAAVLGISLAGLVMLGLAWCVIRINFQSYFCFLAEKYRKDLQAAIEAERESRKIPP